MTSTVENPSDVFIAISSSPRGEKEYFPNYFRYSFLRFSLRGMCSAAGVDYQYIASVDTATQINRYSIVLSRAIFVVFTNR